MEKIISVRLAGRVMPIEETAWGRLQTYVQQQRVTLLQKPGGENQWYDLENQLADLLSGCIMVGHPTLQTADVERSIDSLNRFEVPDLSSNNAVTYLRTVPDIPEKNQPQPAKRLYRNSGKKWLGGVCSGIAYTLRLDPLLIRILSALLLFTKQTVVLAVVGYAIVWIIVPTAPLPARSGRPLYRSRTDKKLGGVCGGLALTFRRESWLFRLLFLAAPLLLLLNQFFKLLRGDSNLALLAGLMLLIYGLMWILLPYASPEQERPL